ncbi:unnamed protein product [Brassica oleracea]|uniref:(rape) hypothetical protein n=1 Tax=Brassica napus TaxID=3708 RepID=A0A816IHU1_BRANA|nr:unnamed protein product [Brassica napus]
MDAGELKIEERTRQRNFVYKTSSTKLFVGLITLYILLSVFNQKHDS